MSKIIKVAIILTVVTILSVAAAVPAMAVGPSENGYGGDPNPGEPPNDVYVPQKAFDARGESPPGNTDNNGAVFHPPTSPPGG